MSSLEVTTLAKVKEVIKNPPASEDSLLGALIQRVSRQFESYMGRELLKAERDEDHDLRAGARYVFLRETPVDLGETFEVRADSERLFTGGPVDASSYHVNPSTGRLALENDASWFIGYGVLRVTYTGGFAADTAELATAYPDIEHAGRQQVGFEWNRRWTPGSTSTSLGSGQRSWTGQVDLLKGVMRVLDGYRRRL